ncbi:MAG: hypothetical protein AAFY26_18695 [Cyanobacteria bacterium J06638_22]
MTELALQVYMKFSMDGQYGKLTIQKEQIRFTGSVEGALLLSQIIYWSKRTQDPEGWFYKTYSDWTEEICLSEYQVRRHVKKFEASGWIETRLRKRNGAPVIHYRLKQGLHESILEFLKHEVCGDIRFHPESRMDSEETQESILEKLPVGNQRNSRIHSGETSGSDSKETQESILEKLPVLSVSHQLHTSTTASTTHVGNTPSAGSATPEPACDESGRSNGLSDRKKLEIKKRWFYGVMLPYYPARLLESGDKVRNFSKVKKNLSRYLGKIPFEAIAPSSIPAEVWDLPAPQIPLEVFKESRASLAMKAMLRQRRRATEVALGSAPEYYPKDEAIAPDIKNPRTWAVTFVKDPATWLNSAAWDEEFEEAPEAPDRPAVPETIGDSLWMQRPETVDKAEYPWFADRDRMLQFFEHLKGAIAAQNDSAERKQAIALAIFNKGCRAAPRSTEYIRLRQHWITFADGTNDSGSSRTLGAELRRTGLSGALPGPWANRFGKGFAADLSGQSLLDYMKWLKTLPDGIGGEGVEAIARRAEQWMEVTANAG